MEIKKVDEKTNGISSICNIFDMSELEIIITSNPQTFGQVQHLSLYILFWF